MKMVSQIDTVNHIKNEQRTVKTERNMRVKNVSRDDMAGESLILRVVGPYRMRVGIFNRQDLDDLTCKRDADWTCVKAIDQRVKCMKLMCVKVVVDGCSARGRGASKIQI